MVCDVLIDSNVYIDLLKRRRDVVADLHAWAEARGYDLAVCGMVRLEVLRGLKSLKAFEKISSLMDVMINVPSDNRLWADAVALAWSLDRKGLVIPGADAVIAASALRIGAAVMTSDAHFAHVPNLQVISLPEEWLG